MSKKFKIMSAILSTGLLIVPTTGLINQFDNNVAKAEEKVSIKRLEDNEEKRNFAEKGLHLHKAGEICSFCGNIINEKEYSELVKYFLADDIKEFQKEIEISKDNYRKIIENIENIKFDKNNFYPNNIH